MERAGGREGHGRGMERTGDESSCRVSGGLLEQKSYRSFCNGVLASKDDDPVP